MVMNKSPRVTLIGPGFPFRGGIAKYTTRLAQLLDEKGHLIDFITPFKQYPAWLYPGKSDIDFDSCPKLTFANPLFSYLEPWTWSHVIHRVHTSSAERVLIPFWSKAQLPFLNHLYRNLRVPSLTILHNLFDHDSHPLTQYLTRKVLNKSEHFLCHSEEITGDPLFQTAPKTIHCQSLPLLPENKSISQDLARAHFKIPPHHKVFLFFGLIRPYKGLSILLGACTHLNSRIPFTLLVAGEPWGKLRKTIQVQIAKSRNHFPCTAELAWVPEHEVPYWFSACDAVVAPYLRATGSSVIAQAMSYQKPIITTPVGGIPMQLSQYPKSYFAPPGDSLSLSEKMLEALKASDAEENKTVMDIRASWDNYVQDLLS